MFALPASTLIHSLAKLFHGSQEESKATRETVVGECKVEELLIFPIASMRSISVKEAEVTPVGLKFDREWILVEQNEEKGLLLYYLIANDDRLGQSQPRFETKDGQDYMVISNPKAKDDLWVKINENYREEQKKISLQARKGAPIDVYLEPEDTHEWFSPLFGGKNVTLARRGNGIRCNQEFVNEEMKSGDKQGAFHSKSAFHAISQISHDDIESKVGRPVNWNCYKANIKWTGCEPYEEENLRELRIGNLNMRCTKHCTRCTVITYDFENGKFHEDKEPLTTIEKYKTHKEIGSIFGVYLQHDEFMNKEEFLAQTGNEEWAKNTKFDNKIRVGDQVVFKSFAADKLVFESPKEQ